MKSGDTNHYIIVCKIGKEIEVWNGRYGWVVVPQDKPHRINVLNRYARIHQAEAAIKRMGGIRRKFARIIRHGDAWQGDALNLELLTGQPTP